MEKLIDKIIDAMKNSDSLTKALSKILCKSKPKQAKDGLECKHN